MELKENFPEVRKQFTIEERVAIGQEIEKILGERRGRPSEKNVDERPHYNNKTRDIVAKTIGFNSGRNYDRAKLIVKKATPEQIEKSIHNMHPACRAGERLR